MSDIKKMKVARKLAYNIFEKTGKIEDYKTYKNVDDLVKKIDAKIAELEEEERKEQELSLYSHHQRSAYRR